MVTADAGGPLARAEATPAGPLLVLKYHFSTISVKYHSQRDS